jgi:hypothetical protein
MNVKTQLGENAQLGAISNRLVILQPEVKACKFDGLVKSRKSPFSVIPAKAPMNTGSSTGIQSFQPVKEELDSGLHRSDDFLRDYQI